MRILDFRFEVLDVKLQTGEFVSKVCNIYQYGLVSTQFQISNLKSQINLVKVGCARRTFQRLGFMGAPYPIDIYQYRSI
ncbi:hypothetical protein D0A37_12535 [Microcoleus vaginatus HSN003]|nr:hypothetical protein D0A37_12535 [Microcoleus vaginatus HSN003]